jgi:ectoine hydroxylase-related dioxygenase (phytanoyl-CoA dioxygenase family)
MAAMESDNPAFFAEHGWLVIRNAVSRERVAELSHAVDEIFARSPPPRPGEVWEQASVSRSSPVIARHTHDAAIARHVAAALGCERVQLLQDTVLVKPARIGGPVEWHQDHTYTGYLRPSRLASVRLALTDCTIDNGCLQLVDGSHNDGPIGDVRALTESRVVDALGARASDWADRIITVELRPGDLSIHHCLTLHRSGPNLSDEARKTLITRVFDSACTLDRACLPRGAEMYFPVNPDGRLAESSFPLL